MKPRKPGGVRVRVEDENQGDRARRPRASSRRRPPHGNAASAPRRGRRSRRGGVMGAAPCRSAAAAVAPGLQRSVAMRSVARSGLAGGRRVVYRRRRRHRTCSHAPGSSEVALGSWWTHKCFWATALLIFGAESFTWHVHASAEEITHPPQPHAVSFHGGGSLHPFSSLKIECTFERRRADRTFG